LPIEAAALLVAAIVYLPLPPGLRLALIVPLALLSVISLSLSITVAGLARSGPARHAFEGMARPVPWVFAFGAACFISAFASLSLTFEGVTYTGISPARVAAISGQTLQDSVKTKTGLCMVTLKVDGAYTDFPQATRPRSDRFCGLRSGWLLDPRQGATARFTQSVLIKDCGAIAQGERLIIGLEQPEGGWGGGPPAFAKKGQVARPGYANRMDQYRALAKRAFVSTVGKIRSTGTPLLIALMTGDRSALSPEEAALYKNAGLVHVLALSGQHIGILAALLGALLIPSLGKRPALVISSAVIVLYLLVTGVQPSILRSVISYLAAAQAWFLNRHPRPTTLFADTFLAAVCLAPGTCASASFLLSYGATLGIILLSRVCDIFLRKWLPSALSADLGVSLGATFGAAPFCVALFGTYNPSAILTSTAAGPLVTIIMWVGFGGSLACAIVPFRWMGETVGFLLEWPYRALTFVVRLGAERCPLAQIDGACARAIVVGSLVIAFVLLYSLRIHDYPQLRFARRAQGLPRTARLFHAEKVRAKLPDQPSHPGKDRDGPGAEG
jgi:ComEC/Rec2-related protein